jgi:uncharacterized protein involved in outer membrane biogenesis
MKKKYSLGKFAFIFAVIAIVSVSAIVVISRLLDPETYRTQILAMAEKSLHRQVSYQKACFSWHSGPSFLFKAIEVKEKNGKGTFFAAEQLAVSLAVIPLLRKEVKIREIVLERPVISLSRNQSGVFNINDFFTGKPAKYKLRIRNIRIKNGLVRFADRMFGHEGVTASLEDLDLQAGSPARGGTTGFKLSAAVPGEGGRAIINLSGKAKIPGEKETFRKAWLDLVLSAKNLNAGQYWQYYGRYLPFERIRGTLDYEGVFRGKLTEFTSKGSARISGLRFTYPRVFHGILTPKDLHFNYDLELTSRNLSIKTLDLTVDGLRVKGSCALNDIHTKDPRIIARAATTPFRLEEFHRYIPYGVIPRSTADFIEQHIKGGIYRLDEGRLDGRISRILHMGRGDNYNALFIRGRVDKGLVTYGPRVPTFNNIKGELEMRGKDFILSRMSGNFGGSPFTIDGKITDYPLDKPSSYPFIMTMNPGRAEIAWLFRQDKTRKLTFRGPSRLRLAGSGTTADYKLDGEWDLSQADYGFPGLVRKRAGQANRIRFSSRLDKTEANLTELRYEAPPLYLTAGAKYRYKEKKPLSFAVITNQFTVSRSFPILPGLQKFGPRGKLQADIKGTGNPAGVGTFRWSGNVSLAEFSFRPLERIKPLSNITGKIRFSEAALETKQLTGRLGDSAFTVNGRVVGVSNPAADLVFSSPGLHLKDIGYQTPSEELEIKKLSGNISLRDGNVAVTSLSGQIKSSSFIMKGNVINIRNPKITLNASFPFLKVEDLASLTRLKRFGKDKGPPRLMVLKARIKSDAGTAGDASFKKLDTELSLENNRLAVHALNVKVFGGTVYARGQADFAAAGGPMYQARYHLDHLDASQLLRAAGAKRYITGLLTAEGELTVRGNNQEELKKTAHGTAKLHLQEGVFYTLPDHQGGEGVKIPYTVLDASLSLRGETLAMQGLNVGVFGGTVSGNGRVDFAAVGGPMYQVRYRFNHVDASQLFKAAGAERDISGLLTGGGELAVRGNNQDDLKKTARGAAKIELNDGMIRFPARAGQEKAPRIPFKKLLTSLSIESNVLYIHSARIDAFGGVISGHGLADFRVPNRPGYRVDFHMDAIDSAKFFRAFEVTKEISGLLTLKGVLIARGDGVAALKKTVRGSVGVHLEKGVINKFNILSKVFSILNVSQLLDFRLPDMVSSGMPYNRIDGNFSFNDGSVSTSDLSINSPSMNISVVGKSDIVKEDIDLTIGVQPFQTVDKIVSRIPIVGWILTGRDRRLLVTYYEAKGKWDDPKVSAIPITSLSRGVFNIFKRTFNLPGKLITDTGKVIMGN